MTRLDFPDCAKGVGIAALSSTEGPRAQARTEPNPSPKDQLRRDERREVCVREVLHEPAAVGAGGEAGSNKALGFHMPPEGVLRDWRVEMKWHPDIADPAFVTARNGRSA